MACKPCQERARAVASARGTAAATGTSYEVLTSSGSPTGRTYGSLIMATREANKIGGSTRPVG